jgi:hypothetical protein
MMKQAFAIFCSASLVLVIGCSDYDIRMGKTFEEMKYEKRLSDNLADAPTNTTLKQDLIYVRPPKGLTQMETFSMAPVEGDKFDIENSFMDKEKQKAFHIVARVKRPKPPAGAKKTTTQTEPTPRGKFVDDVLELIKLAYNVELTPAQLKPEVKTHANRSNSYKAYKLEQEAKEVQLFVYGDSNSPYEVALIFEYPKTEIAYMSPKIGLCLESFAVGERANRAFSGSSEAEAGEEGAGAVAPPI